MKYNSRFKKVIPYINYTHPCCKYTFKNKIGDGSASKIYKCTYKDDPEKYCVIKRIHKKEEWRSELNILKRLKPSNRLVNTLDSYESDRFVYIVTEFYNGSDLFDHIDINVPFNEDFAFRLFKEMVLCVDEIHKTNVAHLDIKCENFMVRSMDPPDIVLIDFGHAEIIEENVLKLGHSKYGTCFYLCPEGYANYYSMKSDIWSLGICFYLFLTGDYPFDGDDDEYEMNVMENNYIGSEKLSERAKNIIERCLEYNPKDRLGIGELKNLLD